MAEDQSLSFIVEGGPLSNEVRIIGALVHRLGNDVTLSAEELDNIVGLTDLSSEDSIRFMATTKAHLEEHGPALIKLDDSACKIESTQGTPSEDPYGAFDEETRKSFATKGLNVSPGYGILEDSEIMEKDDN